MKVFYRNKKEEKEKPQVLQKLSDGSARSLLLLLGHSVTPFFLSFSCSIYACDFVGGTSTLTED